MTARDYRDDDTTDGYCPQCGKPLSTVSLTVGARGYCEQHGWQYADYRASDRDPGDETDEGERRQ